MAVVKCQICGLKEDKSLMTQDKNKKYYHTENCYDKYLTDRAYKQKEAASKLQLSHKIAEVYELESYKLIPSSIYTYIEDIRNDSTLFGKLGKNYKAGIPYEGIAYTYEFCKDRIRDSRNKVLFKNFMGELKYGLAIIRNNLVDAKNHAIQQKRNEKIKDISLNVNDEQEKYISEYIPTTTKKKDELDISDML